MIKPFIQLTPDEFDKLVEDEVTWVELEKKYPKPEWCSYPHATRGVMGCWSLLSFMVKNEQDCQKCNLYILDKGKKRPKDRWKWQR